MNCKKANKQISALIDGRLNEKDRSVLLEHIDVCPQCKKLYDSMQAMVGSLSAFGDVPLPEGAENRIHFALEREAQKPRRKNWIKFAAIAMPATAAVFAAAFGISYIFSGGMGSSGMQKEAAFDMASVSEESSMLKQAPNMVAAEEEKAEALEGPLMDGDGERMMTITGEGVDIIAEYSVDVVYIGQSLEETVDFAEQIRSLYDSPDDSYAEYGATIIDEAQGRVTIYLPNGYYEDFVKAVEEYENANITQSDENVKPELTESGLFEVNFLFQENN